MNKTKSANVMFSSATRKVQTELGSADFIQRKADRGHWGAELCCEQQEFVAQRDSFYFGTASAQGEPYIQHRGGSSGFIQIENASTIWFPDYGGNRQFISIGNLSVNPKAYIFLMDYPNQRRLKLWGEAFVCKVEQLPVRHELLNDGYNAQRVIRFDIHALDENCRQYITPRYSQNEYLKEAENANREVSRLRKKLAVLEAKLLSH